LLQKKKQRDDDACFFVFGSGDARAEKTERGERFFFFVGCGREVRRYLFHSYSSEVECDGCEILARSEQ
jgi:hypothetical protein